MADFATIFKVGSWALGLLFVFSMTVLGHFMTRLRSDNSEIKAEIAKTAEETVKNREEIHRLELKIADEYAQKDDLNDLREELKEARRESKLNFEKMYELQMQVLKGLK